MLELPVSTVFNKRIPKQKFYDHLSVTTELKRVFIDQIAMIYWRNKIAASTLNVEAGKTVIELEIFEIRLNQQSLDTKVLQLIDREISYHILYVLSFNGLNQVWIGYKEPSLTKQGVFKVDRYYHTEWIEPNQLELRLEGLTLDTIYDNFIRQIAGDRLRFTETVADDAMVSLKEAMERDDRRQKLQKQIAKMEIKIKNEKQFNLRIELNVELKLLRTELERLK